MMNCQSSFFVIHPIYGNRLNTRRFLFVRSSCLLVMFVLSFGLICITVGNFRTTDEASVLMKTGAFDKFTDDLHCKKSTNLLRGDILVTKTQGHTVVVLTDGSKASEEAPLTLGCRTLKNGSAGTDVRELQEKLVKLGFDVGSCGVDGDYGADTEKAVKIFQKANGLEATGVYDAATHAKLVIDKPTVAPVPEEKPAGSTVQIFAENGGSVNTRC